MPQFYHSSKKISISKPNLIGCFYQHQGSREFIRKWYDWSLETVLLYLKFETFFAMVVEGHF